MRLQALDNSPFAEFKNKAGIVLPERHADYYVVNVGHHRVPMERHQLHIIGGQELVRYDGGARERCPGQKS